MLERLPAYSGFPVELSGAGERHAAFLNESRTRGYWWRPVQEIRIRGPKKMGAAPQSLVLNPQSNPYPQPGCFVGLRVEVCALSALCAVWVEVCALSALSAVWVEVAP